MTDKELLDAIEQYLITKKINIGNTIVFDKKNTYMFSDYIRAMIYSLLSAVNGWKKIEENLSSVDKLFFQYDKEKIQKQDWLYFYEGIKVLGIATITTRKQMQALHKNIHTLEVIEKQYGTLDLFVQSRKPIYIASMLSNDLEYKLDYLGLPLACEMLRNVGVDLIKPDTHLRRIFGKDRLGYSDGQVASELEAYLIAEKMSKETGYSMNKIDSLLWNFCANNYGGICGANPKCEECVIRERCNKMKRD